MCIDRRKKKCRKTPDDPLNLTHSHGQKSNLVQHDKKNIDINPFYCYFASVIRKGQGVNRLDIGFYLYFMAVE